MMLKDLKVEQIKKSLHPKNLFMEIGKTFIASLTV